MRKSVQSIVTLAHRPNETADGVDVVLARNSPTVLVNLGDGDLDGAVVLGLDDLSSDVLASRRGLPYPKDDELGWWLSTFAERAWRGRVSYDFTEGGLQMTH